MAAPRNLYTIALVAQILDEDQEYLEELAYNSVGPWDGCLTVHGPADEVTMALTDDGIEYLSQLVLDAKS